MKRGTKPQLTEELSAKIRTLYLDGKNYITIQKILDIKPTTWDSWVYKNYMDFRVHLMNIKHERMIRKAEIKVEALMDSEDERVSTKNAHFTLETLAKELGYSKRTEVTGKDGRDLVPDKETQDKVDKTLDNYLNDNKTNTQTG